MDSRRLRGGLRHKALKAEDRKQFFDWLNNYIKAIEKYEPGHWSAEARYFCEDSKIILGDSVAQAEEDIFSNEVYKYKRFAKREEVVAMLDRLLN